MSRRTTSSHVLLAVVMAFAAAPIATASLPGRIETLEAFVEEAGLVMAPVPRAMRRDRRSPRDFCCG